MDAEQADVLRARERAGDEEVAAEQGVRGTIAATRDRDSSGESTHEARNLRNRRTAVVRRSAAQSGGVRLPPDQAGSSRPATRRWNSSSTLLCLLGIGPFAVTTVAGKACCLRKTGTTSEVRGPP